MCVRPEWVQLIIGQGEKQCLLLHISFGFFIIIIKWKCFTVISHSLSLSLVSMLRVFKACHVYYVKFCSNLITLQRVRLLFVWMCESAVKLYFSNADEWQFTFMVMYDRCPFNLSCHFALTHILAWPALPDNNTTQRVKLRAQNKKKVHLRWSKHLNQIDQIKATINWNREITKQKAH